MELPDFKDKQGIIRKLGLLMPTGEPLLMAKAYETLAYPILTDAEIIKLISNTERIPARQLFDDHWVKEGDQSTHGSCNGWMTASMLSKIRWKRGIRDGVVMSGSYIYAWINGNKDQGSSLSKDVDILTKYGAPPASLVPANLIYRKQMPKSADAEAAKHKGFVMYYTDDLQAWKSGVALGGVGGMAVQVDSRFKNYSGNGIVPPAHGGGNHAVHADDIVTYKGELCIDSPNNWGLGWGNKGRGLFSFDSVEETSKVHKFWIMFTSTESSNTVAGE